MTLKTVQQPHQGHWAVYRKWLCFWFLIEYGFHGEWLALQYADKFICERSGKERANIYKTHTVYKSNPSTTIGMD